MILLILALAIGWNHWDADGRLEGIRQTSNRVSGNPSELNGLD